MKNFKRVVEDFVCGNCGEKVAGDGYTDHCPKCLWGKHVDKEIPGDRAAECKQLMEPIKTIYQKDVFRIVYRCQGCRHEFVVKTGENDNRDLLIKLSAE